MAKPAVDLGVQRNEKARIRRLRSGRAVIDTQVVSASIRSVPNGWVLEALHVCPSCSASVRLDVAIGADQLPTSTVRGKRMHFVRDPETLEIVEMLSSDIDLPLPPPRP